MGVECAHRRLSLTEYIQGFKVMIPAGAVLKSMISKHLAQLGIHNVLTSCNASLQPKIQLPGF